MMMMMTCYSIQYCVLYINLSETFGHVNCTLSRSFPFRAWFAFRYYLIWFYQLGISWHRYFRSTGRWKYVIRLGYNFFFSSCFVFGVVCSAQNGIFSLIVHCLKGKMMMFHMRHIPFFIFFFSSSFTLWKFALVIPYPKLRIQIVEHEFLLWNWWNKK